MNKDQVDINIFKPMIICSNKLRQIPVTDNGEKLVDTKDFCPKLKFEIASYIIDPKEIIEARFVRKTVANMVNNAIEHLPQGYAFILRCGHRSLGTQKRSYNGLRTRLKEENPDWDIATLENRLDECVAPIDIAPHCTGGAIDIFLCDDDGNYIDIECQPGELSDRTYTYSSVISNEARKNRDIFIHALTKAGFNNFPGEVWHWAYGEFDWAAYQNKPAVIYGLVEIQNGNHISI